MRPLAEAETPTGVWEANPTGNKPRCGIAHKENDMPKCRLRYDVRFSAEEIGSVLDTIAEKLQYDDHAGVAPDRVLVRAYDKLQWRIQQNQRRDYVVRELQAQNKTAPENQGLGSSGARGSLDNASSALRVLQCGSFLGRKKRGFHA